MYRLSLLLALLISLPLRADKPAELTVEQLAEQVRKSVVVVTTPGRDDKRGGLGTGFVIGEGLIATNFHVIGQGRAIAVETSDGKKHNAISVHAHDDRLDLAIIKIEAKGLPVLPVGDADKLKDGQSVVIVGNPQGLKNSIVSGVVSGKRDIEGRSMLQLAVPVERGNSGGPVVDRQGNVVGIVTMKSAVTENLGFAVSINALKPLLAKPNPIAMAAWKTIGQLDADDWKPMLGSDWRQRAGRILADEPGVGFGGRTFCLSQQATPKIPFEISVSVKLDDEAGAAGLIFHADDDVKHYGFYPSGGGLRLTRFDGTDVFSWKILENSPHEAYRPGDWNTLKVRIEKGKILCYVNDKLFVESEDAVFTTGKVGLAKFRNTKAEFKQFRIGEKLASATATADAAERVRKELAALKAAMPSEEVLRKLAKEGTAGLTEIRARAKQLEEDAARLRRLAGNVHRQGVLDDLNKVLSAKQPDLLHAALLVAKIDNEELDIAFYQQDFERMAKRLISKFPKDADELAKRKALTDYLFTERGFHGSRGDYYHRSNSYLNEVLDDREGLPITLAVVYMELGRRIGLKIEGVGLPGHFVVRHVPTKGEAQLLDVYDAGKPLSRADAEKKVKDITGDAFDERSLDAVAPRAIIVRMFNNLLRVAQEERDNEGSLRYLDALVLLDPEASARERGLRALTRAQLGDKAGALSDLDWILDKMPEGVDLNAVRSLRNRIERSR